MNIHQQLRSLYSDENVEYRPFLDAISDCEAGSMTTVDNLLAKVSSTDPEGGWTRKIVVEALKEMRDLGLGAFTKGAKGHPSRMEWAFDTNDIRSAALGEDSSLPTQNWAKFERELGTGDIHGKSLWDFDEVTEFLSKLTGVRRKDIRIAMTITEAKDVLARAQGISAEDVRIHLG